MIFHVNTLEFHCGSSDYGQTTPFFNIQEIVQWVHCNNDKTAENATSKEELKILYILRPFADKNILANIFGDFNIFFDNNLRKNIIWMRA